MLIEFSVENFRSFGERQTLSMVAGKGTRGNKKDPRVVRREGLDLLKAAAIYGPNASGKSNFVKAMKVMEDTVKKSFKSLTLGDKIPGIVPFRLQEELADLPSRFEIVFEDDGSVFQYSFAATASMIHEERLTVREAGQPEKIWLDRTLNADSAEYEWYVGGPVVEGEDIIVKRTRNNALALSVGADFNVPGLCELFVWFPLNLMVLDLVQSPVWIMALVAAFMQDTDVEGLLALRDAAVDALRQADIDVDGLIIEEGEGLPEDGNVESLMDIRVGHKVNGSDRVEFFDFFEDESKGTQRFISLFWPMHLAADMGKILFIDELDCSLHPMLVRKLLEVFQSDEVNGNGGQVIFTTHDVTLMDPKLLRHDQVWLVEKNERAQSGLRSIYDYREDGVRKSTVFWRNYLAGRYGAVPMFGPDFAGIELE